jgi:hypothetical protein
MISMSQSGKDPYHVLPGKKGAAFALGKKENHPKIRALRPHWYYSWSSRSTHIFKDFIQDFSLEDAEMSLNQSSIEFLPMLWGYYPKVFVERIKEAVAQRPKMILGFNEPDNTNQSNIPVADALKAWPILEAAIEGQGMSAEILLVSPSCVDPLGPWMTTFMAQVNKKKLRIDVIGVHHYGSASVQAFQTRMQRIYEWYGGRPLLITELAVADWKAKSVKENRFKPTDVLQFMQMILPWMEAQEWIVGYAWFSFEIDNPQGTSSALFDLENHLTQLGRYYASFIARGSHCPKDFVEALKC